MALDGNYEVKKGDTLWGVAKKQLQAAGSQKPTNAQIMAAMKQIAQANGCKDVDECANKFFNKVGNKLDVTGFTNRASDETFVDFQDGAVQGQPKADKPAQPSSPDTETPTGTNLPTLTDAQLKELKEKLGREFPQLSDIDNEQLKKIIEELKKKYPDLFKPDKPQPSPIGSGTLTHVNGESGDGSTTKSIGEEGGGWTTMATNEEGGSDATTKGLNEEGGTIGTTKALGEEGGADVTTRGLNEEGGNAFTERTNESGGSIGTTKALGEEGGAHITTMATNEEGGSGSITLAVGENGDGVTTKSIGEEGGSTILPNPIKIPDNIKELLEKYMKEHPEMFKKQ